MDEQLVKHASIFYSSVAFCPITPKFINPEALQILFLQSDSISYSGHRVSHAFFLDYFLLQDLLIESSIGNILSSLVKLSSISCASVEDYLGSVLGCYYQGDGFPTNNLISLCGSHLDYNANQPDH